jgi:hypothetical protein
MYVHNAQHSKASFLNVIDNPLKVTFDELNPKCI